MAIQKKFSKEENEILKSFEKGEWKSATNVRARVKDYARYARESLKKDKRINIRINEKDLESIQSIAVDEGIPYQTLISSLIHKYVTGRLTDKSHN